MQASSLAVKGGIFRDQNQRGLEGFGEFRNRNVLRHRRVCMNKKSNYCGLRLGSVTMETEIISGRVGSSGIFGSSAKARSVRVHVSDGDIENVVPIVPQGKSSGTVLPFVGVACLGAIILFGYHLGVVNGALEYLAKDLGITENTVLQGTSRRMASRKKFRWNPELGGGAWNCGIGAVVPISCEHMAVC